MQSLSAHELSHAAGGAYYYNAYNAYNGYRLKTPSGATSWCQSTSTGFGCHFGGSGVGTTHSSGQVYTNHDGTGSKRN